jgi:hypothetical protein
MFQIGFPASPCWCGVSAGECTHDSTYHTSLFGNASLVWAGTPARPGGALRNIIARFPVHGNPASDVRTQAARH